MRQWMIVRAARPERGMGMDGSAFGESWLRSWLAMIAFVAILGWSLIEGVIWLVGWIIKHVMII